MAQEKSQGLMPYFELKLPPVTPADRTWQLAAAEISGEGASNNAVEECRTLEEATALRAMKEEKAVQKFNQPMQQTIQTLSRLLRGYAICSAFPREEEDIVIKRRPPLLL